MQRLLIAVLLAGWMGLVALPGQAARERYRPGIKIVLEVRTPTGDLRSFQRPGAPPTYWAQDLPVVQGDRVTINPMVTTGGSELAELRIRLDQKELASRAAPPWTVPVDTSGLATGYHVVEVWAATKSPGRAENSANITFLVVPQNDSLLRTLQPGGGGAGPPVTDEERLACAIRSADPKADKQINLSSTATVAGPTLFFISAAPASKEFFYTLTRDGLVTYTSPRLPILTHILLEPQKAESGQAPGRLILTARAGDGEGRFGPPAWITVQIEGEAAAK